MPVVPIMLKPIENKKDAMYFWKQIKASGKPSKKALYRLKKYYSKEKSLAGETSEAFERKGLKT